MKRKRWSGLTALAVTVSMFAGFAGAMTTANAAEVDNGGALTLNQRVLKGEKGKVAPSVAGASGKIDAFISTTGTAGVEKKTQVLDRLDLLRSGSPSQREQQANSEGRQSASKAGATANRVFAELKKIDPSAQMTFVTSYSTTGVAVRADASALRDLVKRSKNVLRVSSLPKMTVADDPSTSGQAGTAKARAADGETKATANGNDTTPAPTGNAGDSSKAADPKSDETPKAGVQSEAPSATQGSAQTQSSAQPEAQDAGEVPYNKHSDQFINAVNTWNQTGKTGEGVNVAVVDTGLDYTHADFGGVGTPSAYQTALSSTADPLTDPTLKTLLDSGKFKGGYDFAGPVYGSDDASGNMIDTPTPDANPIDGEGGHHGTHVAGTVAGYGITAGGSRFSGNYTSLNNSDVQGMKIGPGSAPKAGLYSLKVFGDNGGSTGLTLEALDWVSRHNLSCAPADKISIVSMSLGSSFSQGDEPDAAAVDNLSKDGVVSVIAAGNDGDYTDILGSPGSARSALTVAASETGMILQDAIKVTAGPSVINGRYLAGQYSSGFTGSFNVTAPVVAIKGSTDDPNDNAEGCKAYSAADAAAVNGKIAYVHWDDSNVSCGSRARFNNAEHAGAVGIIFDSQQNVPAAGIAGNSTIPGFQIIKQDSDDISLDSLIEAGGVSVQLGDALKQTQENDYSGEIADTIADFSSRGIHGSYNGTIKPDVAAPGVGIGSASAGSGNGMEVMQGTSMATPLVSGVTALVRGAHPDWSASQVKEQMINTATHDIKTDHTPNAKTYGPMRVGTGRVDALAAVNNPVQVSSDDPSAVTAGFGVVQVGQNGYSAKKTITVSNTSSVARNFSVAYLPRTQTPGVNYTLSTSNVTVPANGSANFDINLSVPDQSALRHTVGDTQTDSAQGIASAIVTDATGVIELTPTDSAPNASPLRVAVAVAPKPVSNTNTTYAVASDGSKSLVTGGQGISQGIGNQKYVSRQIPLVLSATDSETAKDDEVAAGWPVRGSQAYDIRAIGYSSTAPQVSDPTNAAVSFGIVTDKSWSHLADGFNFDIDIDTDGDGQIDRIIEPSLRYQGNQLDTAIALVAKVSGGNTTIVDQVEIDPEFVNDSNQLVVTVPLSDLADVTSASTSAPMSYKVESSYLGTNQTVDEVGSFSDTKFDAIKPAMWYGNAGLGSNGDFEFPDQNGTTIPVHMAQAAPQVSAQGGSADERIPATLLVHTLGQVPDNDAQTFSMDVASRAGKTDLQAAIDAAAGLNEADYTAASWSQLQTALASARAVMADEDATQSDVDTATTVLRNAEHALAQQVAGQSDRDVLQAAVDAASRLNQSDYTADSWRAFASALAQAKSLLANPNAAKNDVVAATVALKQAQQGLQRLEGGSAGVGPAAPGIGSAAPGLASAASLSSRSSRRSRGSRGLATTGSSVVFEVLAAVTLLAGGVAVSFAKRRHMMRL
ncbi:S8 family serine peptidase [Bifidobacterium sp. ESL0798]|uniref:S8 family serine peptidase n=1 Tax=Bifidobacterium sp. ESL0798 TaxID=2983235 RepID=UPI0023F729D6|nr:S8 family serine peptidase [Bifidobacterium sp. ESL0798]